MFRLPDLKSFGTRRKDSCLCSVYFRLFAPEQRVAKKMPKTHQNQPFWITAMQRPRDEIMIENNVL